MSDDTNSLEDTLANSRRIAGENADRLAIVDATVEEIQRIVNSWNSMLATELEAIIARYDAQIKELIR